jgi:hypothetical protein
MVGIDLTGRRFGRLVVISKSLGPSRYRKWICCCDCGKEVMVIGNNLVRGHTSSCGCLKVEAGSRAGKASWMQNKPNNKTHGQSCIDENHNQTREYNIWTHIKQRCYNPKRDNYRYYGGRGISMCQEWKDSYESFFHDMGTAPVGHEIDRKDNDGNYEPSNCRWVTRAENLRHQRPRKAKTS